MLTEKMMRELTGEVARERDEQRKRNMAVVIAEGVAKAGETEDKTRDSIAAYQDDMDYYDYDWLDIHSWEDWLRTRDRVHELVRCDDGDEDGRYLRYWDRKLNEEPICPIIRELYEWFRTGKPAEMLSALPDYDPMRPDHILTIPAKVSPNGYHGSKSYMESVAAFDAWLEEGIAEAESNGGDITHVEIHILNESDNDLRPLVEHWCAWHKPVTHCCIISVGPRERWYDYPWSDGGDDIFTTEDCSASYNYDTGRMEAAFTPEYIRRNGLPYFLNSSGRAFHRKLDDLSPAAIKWARLILC